ncbi:MAG: hypothetical protein HQ503_13055 [Rhodospirillales bacterium]|nr:hypothetical protein [Rhodospirillales bacterium]
MFDVLKREKAEQANRRIIAKQVEPFFSSLLVLACAFMSVLLFGSGAILGGAAFLAPVIIAAFVYWDDGRAPSAGTPDTPENGPGDRFGV